MKVYLVKQKDRSWHSVNWYRKDRVISVLALKGKGLWVLTSS